MLSPIVIREQKKTKLQQQRSRRIVFVPIPYVIRDQRGHFCASWSLLEAAWSLPEPPGGSPELPGGFPEPPGGFPEPPAGFPELPGASQRLPGASRRLPGASAIVSMHQHVPVTYKPYTSCIDPILKLYNFCIGAVCNTQYVHNMHAIRLQSVYILYENQHRSM